MGKSVDLTLAKKRKKDEFYTQLVDVENELRHYREHFKGKVVNWVTTLFPAYRREMKGLDWGRFYAKYGARKYNPAVLEKSVAELMADREVQSKKEIYEFLLSDRTLPEKLNLRVFDPDDMRTAYENMRTSRASARSANGVTRSRRCAATTSGRGRRAGRRTPKTSRCSARTATPARATSSEICFTKGRR